MLHSTSGKHGFSNHRLRNQFVIEKEQMKRILEEEERLRFSPEYQQAVTEDDSLENIKEQTYRIQYQALKKGGVAENDLDDALVVLHNARWDYRDDPEMNRITVYMREDVSKRGDLQDSQQIVDVPLVDLKGNKINLLELLHSKEVFPDPKLPFVVLAGSAS